MSKKIKDITLTGFRAFSDERKLSFETQNGVADIVVIHAPNGTGKTSTIEAMEWAVTGKISRIKDIAQNTGGKNFKPKEGYILKNKNYKGLTSKVSIELTSGQRIVRKTSPLGNKNSDYDSGEVICSIDNMKSFENNILSQGYISKFSYEASNGSLFKSLIENQNKGNSEDIALYDKINGLKGKLDNSILERRNVIRYIKKTISDNEKELNELKNKIVINSDFSKSNDYAFFKQKFSSYQDLSEKNYDESITYLKGLDPTLTSLKTKLLNFNIDDYKTNLKKLLKSNKLIEIKNSISEATFKKKQLSEDYSREEKEKENLSNYLLESNLKSLSSDIKEYNKNKSIISDIHERLKGKAKTVSSIKQRISNIRFTDLHEKSETIERIILELNALFPDESLYSDIVFEPDNMLGANNGEINAKKIELSQLNLNYFLSLKDNEEISKELSYKRRRVSELDSNLNSLIEEKKNIVSFDEKLALIKSYVVEAVNEKSLQDCPACGTSYVDREALLAAVNSVKSNSKSLLDGSIENITKERNEVLNEISSLNEKIEKALSNAKAVVNEHIVKLSERGDKLESLFSNIRSLNLELDNESNLQDLVQLVLNKSLLVKKSMSIAQKRKSKYENLLAKLERLVLEDKSDLEHLSLRQKDFSNYCAMYNGMSINEVISESNYLHVTMYKHYLHLNNLKSIEKQILEVENKLKNLYVDLNTLSANFTFLDYEDCEELSRKSLVNIKKIRADYNFIKSHVHGFKVPMSEKIIDFITRFKESLEIYLSHMLLLQEIEVKKNIISKSSDELNKAEKELSEANSTLYKVNLSIEDTKEYFAMVASESINSDILNDMFMYVEPHLKYDKISFRVDIKNSNKGIYIQAGSSSSSDKNTPVYYLSEAQINILSICIFLAQHARKVESSINTIVIDDPVQSMDDLNSYALIDLCKIFSRRFDKQIIITTHNRSFFNLFKRKLPEERYSTKFISL